MMKLILRGSIIGALTLIATQELSAMCLATPCYLLRIAVASTDFPGGSATCLLDGTLISSKRVECNGVNAYRRFDPSALDSNRELPKSISFPLQLNEDRASCKSLHSGNEEIMLYAFQDCCDTPGRNCLRGYQARIVRSQS